MCTLYACKNQLNSCLHHSPLIIRGVCHLFNEGRGCREADDFMRGKKSVGSLLPEHKFYHILKRGHRKREWGFEPPIDELLGSGAPNLGAGVRPLSVEWSGENGDGLELSAIHLKEFRTRSAGQVTRSFHENDDRRRRLVGCRLRFLCLQSSLNEDKPQYPAAAEGFWINKWILRPAFHRQI